MKEENIRPDVLMQENSLLFEEDVAQLLLHKNKFVNVPCPACESENYNFLFTKSGFDFVCCSRCETVFINPRPDLVLLEEFYSTSKSAKHWNDKIFPASENSRRTQIFSPRAERVVQLCLKYGEDKNKVLVDVGAGYGTFCQEIQKHNVFEKIIAVEPSTELAATCRYKGLHVIEQMIEKVKIEHVDVLTNFELIEHLFCPKDFIHSCSKMLSPGGLLILTTPNIKGFDLLVLGKLSENIRGPNHLNYFHPDSLSVLLKICGFETIEILTPGMLDAELVRKKILDGKLDTSHCPFFTQILINQWETVGESFQHFLVSNKLSSHLWIVARKTR
jgi:2-polyprenyl-3-methyl-5-hydroxy-6-metoxy-1,4-benzoquinol methylase